MNKQEWKQWYRHRRLEARTTARQEFDKHPAVLTCYVPCLLPLTVNFNYYRDWYGHLPMIKIVVRRSDE